MYPSPPEGICCFFNPFLHIVAQKSIQWDQQGFLRVNLNATFLLKSAYLHCTHTRALLMRNLNAK